MLLLVNETEYVYVNFSNKLSNNEKTVEVNNVRILRIINR